MPVISVSAFILRPVIAVKSITPADSRYITEFADNFPPLIVKVLLPYAPTAPAVVIDPVPTPVSPVEPIKNPFVWLPKYPKLDLIVPVISASDAIKNPVGDTEKVEPFVNCVPEIMPPTIVPVPLPTMLLALIVQPFNVPLVIVPK